jgi:hypothetical protein
VVKQDDGSVEHCPEVMRRRARCSLKSCPVGSWTVYEESGYPHRVFQLDVVVCAVCMVALGGTTLTASGAAHLCSRDTVRRWLRWVCGLAEPRDIEGLCARLDPDGMVSQPLLRDGGRAAKVLWLLERLAELLTQRGVPVRRRGSGLARVVGYIFERFRQVLYLTKSSPPLRADLGRLCI